MEIRKRRSWQKWGIGAMALGISIFFLIFTNLLVGELSMEKKAQVEALAKAYAAFNQELDDYTDVLNTIRNNQTIPIILADGNGNPVDHKNLDSAKVAEPGFLEAEISRMSFYNSPIPIKINADEEWYIYYKEQPAITLLRYFPYLQLLLISVFLVITYMAFNASRRAEQNRVWVGLAKETAHQIGTPLSSLMAWVEYMKASEGKVDNDILDELEKDLHRLDVITERFSKIGSVPELKPVAIFPLAQEAIGYLSRRISRQVSVSMHPRSAQEPLAMINKNLFDWVLENLVKNSVDAMDGVGKIIFRISETKTHVYLDIKDTGKGIARSQFKTVFEPGFTTKQRGWGLGLSLAKRIIENYHSGEIFVHDSEIGSGTTFRIKLVKA